MKAKAPPPPPAPQPAPRKIFRNAVPDGGGSPGGDTKENMLRPMVDLHITLPDAYQTTVTVDGRKALMDLLVDLCSQYHLNPAYHTLELLSPEAHPVAFKPNALLGALDVSCALIKARVTEERVVKKPPPRVPEKSVRLVVNYHRGQKAVVRVNPLVPLQNLVPVICQKCEFDPAHVLLLKDSISSHELDLHKSLSELEIRELYVLDQTLAESIRSNTPSTSGGEKKGLLGFFKFNRRKSKTEEQSAEDMDELDDSVMQNTGTYENGLSVVVGPCVEVRPNTLGQSQSAMNLSRLSPKFEPKKRRAPAPPPPSAHTHTAALVSQAKPGSPRLDSQMKKRKAPAPPPTPAPSTPELTLTYPPAIVHVPAPASALSRTSEPTQVLSSTLVADDSLSDLSHSIEDSEPVGSVCSSSSDDAAAESASSSSLAEEPMPEPVYVRAARFTPVPVPKPEPEQEQKQEKEQEPHPQPTPRNIVKEEPGPSSTVEETEDTESVLELKMEEVENNRHSAIGSESNVPLKPRRSPLQKQTELTSSYPPFSHPPPIGQDLQQTSEDVHIETAPHSWLHSVEPKVEQEVETVSMCSSESLADQGYAASEGMADDSGLLSSPSDLTQPTSPEDNISLTHDPSPSPSHQPKDCSSDSDEGCATWGSRHSGGARQGNETDRRKHNYEEEAKITAEINLTLADLDADLAEANHSDEAPACMDDEIPVSVVDVDIPVTTIDEVLEDLTSRRPHGTGRGTEGESRKKQDVTDSSNKLSVDVQNKNNNARVADKTMLSQTQTNHIEIPEKVIVSPVVITKAQPEKPEVVSCSVQQRSQSPAVQSVSENRLKPPPLVRSYSLENPEMQRALSSKPPTAAQIKITQSPVSKFGLKTFTVIPPKPAVSHTHKPAGTLSTGAIKIDEFGNMVKQRAARPASVQDKCDHTDDATNDPASPLLGKAKAFWSSAEKQDASSTANKESPVRIREAEVPKPVPVPVTVISQQPPEKPSVDQVEKLKEANGSTNHSVSAAMNKLPASDPIETTSFSEQRKNLFFLKPSRRTSSQYVASAIAKYTSIPSTKSNGLQELPESTTAGQRQLSKQNFKPEVRSNYKDPHTSTNAPTNPVPYFAGPKRSQSYPNHNVEDQADSEEPQFTGTSRSTRTFGAATSKSLDSSPVNAKLQEQVKASTFTESVQVSSKEYTSTKNAPETSSPTKSPNATNAIRPPIAKKPDMHSPGVLPEPNQVSIFGPVKKFKPVMLKSVEKETSLHSSLMEAIQSGEGAERLKKVSGTSLTATTKKPSFVETENEHSALLSAIRAQSNSTRLKKTKSEAAAELEQFRKVEEDQSAQKHVPCPSSPEPPAFIPPPPPVFAPPPPPPPPSAPSKPAVVLPAGGNPELAREALLEAIRTGAGAERLRKVPASVKTLQVNGRLGIIKPSSSFSQEH